MKKIVSLSFLTFAASLFATGLFAAWLTGCGGEPPADSSAAPDIGVAKEAAFLDSEGRFLSTSGVSNKAWVQQILMGFEQEDVVDQDPSVSTFYYFNHPVSATLFHGQTYDSTTKRYDDFRLLIDSVRDGLPSNNITCNLSLATGIFDDGFVFRQFPSQLRATPVSGTFAGGIQNAPTIGGPTGNYCSDINGSWGARPKVIEVQYAPSKVAKPHGGSGSAGTAKYLLVRMDIDFPAINKTNRYWIRLDRQAP